MVDNQILDTSYEENCVIAALLQGGITLENAIAIARIQVRDDVVPLKPYEISGIEDVDMSIYDVIRASDILDAYFGVDDDEVVHLTSCLHCGEEIIGDITHIGQTLLYHTVAHLHEANVARMMEYGEEISTCYLQEDNQVRSEKRIVYRLPSQSDVVIW